MKYGINSLRFRGAMLWNALNDDANKIESVAAFKKEIKTLDGIDCLFTIVNRRFFRFIVNSWCKLALCL